MYKETRKKNRNNLIDKSKQSEAILDVYSTKKINENFDLTYEDLYDYRFRRRKV